MSIYIAAHKDFATPRSDLYRVIGLGGFRPDHPGALTDSTGDGISDRNRFYCELTGTYWLWKNVTDDFIGLCHYRRYFNFVPIRDKRHEVRIGYGEALRDLLDQEEQRRRVEALLDRYDVIVPRAVFEGVSVDLSYRHAHRAVEWDAFLARLDLLYGRRNHSLDIENRFHVGNMLIARRDVFALYAQQLFFVLEGVVEAVGFPEPVDGARYQPYRYPGYLAERFTAAFLRANRLRYHEAQIITVEGV